MFAIRRAAIFPEAGSGKKELGSMKVGAAIAEIMKREGVEILAG